MSGKNGLIREENTLAHQAVVMDEIKDNMAMLRDEVSANDFIKRIDKFEHVGNSKSVAGRMLANRAKELGLVLNGEKRYEKAVQKVETL